MSKYASTLGKRGRKSVSKQVCKYSNAVGMFLSAVKYVNALEDRNLKQSKRASMQALLGKIEYKVKMLASMQVHVQKGKVQK